MVATEKTAPVMRSLHDGFAHSGEQRCLLSSQFPLAASDT
jgi:hypothetical protein